MIYSIEYPDTMPNAKPPAKKKPRKKPPLAYVEPEVVQAGGRPAKLFERQQFCALVATGMSLGQAYQTLFPHVALDSARLAGHRWSVTHADEIARLKQAAADAAAMAHGINAAYLLGHAKAILETPISQLGPDNIYTKKYKVTETMTDAGPKTTLEVEKDSPLSAVQAMAKMIGADGCLAPKPDQATGQPSDDQAEQQALGRALARIIGAGSPIARRLADTKKA
jgi:hypothetical protein